MENPLDTLDTQADAFDTGVLAARAPQEALGQSLKSRREQMEVSLEQISRTTKIPKSSLLHLESGNFGKLPGDVFVRGFLRSYAGCLKLNGDEIVARYARCGLNPAPVSSALAESLLDSRPRRFPRATGAPDAENSGANSSESEAGAVQSTSAGSDSVRNVLRDAFDLRRGKSKGQTERDADAPRSKGTKPKNKNRRRNQRRPSHQPSRQDDCPSKEGASSDADTPPRQRNFIPPRLNFNDEMSHRGPLTLGVIILVIVATLTMSYLLRRPGTSVDGFTMAPASTSEFCQSEFCPSELLASADAFSADSFRGATLLGSTPPS